jgi:putative ABC transport system permease protein
VSRLKGMAARLRSLLRPGEADARAEEELRFHLEMETARLVREGWPPDEARRRTLMAFGSPTGHRETMRDERGWRWLDELGADLRYALRGMRRSPGFALATALTLGVGIGVNGMVVGYVNALLFRPIPAAAPERLVALFTRDTRTGAIGQLLYDDYLDYRDRSAAFADLAGMVGVPLNVVIPQASGSVAGDMVWGEMVTENYFTLLGMTPAAGRFFRATDAPQGANPFVVLSYDCWRRRFHGDPDVGGRVVRVNGTEFTITGVAPRGFRGLRLFGFWPEMWVPIGMHPVVLPGSTGVLQGRGAGFLQVFGRMKPGFDRACTAAAAVFARQLAASYPEANADLTALLLPARVGFDNPAFVKPGVLLLSSTLGVFGSLVLLAIICANLANLQLARAAAREREIAIRLSLGCSRARLTRQLVVESTVLALPGCAIALALLRANEIIERQLAPKLQFEVGLAAGADHRVMLFTGLVAVVAVAVFGLVPARRASRPDVVPPLTSVDAAARRGRHPTRLRGALVVIQLALSVVLLVGGMLFVRSLMAARTADVGFDPRGRALVSINVGLQGYDERRGRDFYDRVLARVRALPNVAAAGLAYPVPFDTYGRTTPWYIDGLANARDGTVRLNTSVASDGFVGALGLRLADGRDFTPADSADAPLAMIVSRSLAARLWPTAGNPLGQRARYGGPDGPEATVVGVVDDATFIVIGDAPGGHLYLPLRQHYRDWQTLVVHTTGNAAAMLPRLEDAIAGLDPALPAFGGITMEEAVASGFSAPRNAAVIAGFFGVFALLIASVGLYALVAGGVAERTREIGVRLALGSTPGGVLRLVMGDGARLGVVGLGLGLAGALGVARAMAGLLYGLSPSDPVTFVVVPLTLGAVVLLATYLPARRAVKLDPVAALRSE